MSLKNGLAALVVAALLSSTAAAQESLLPLPLEKTSVAAALARSKREHRVLIVVREWKRPPQGRRPWWMNDSVRAWIAWHGVLVELKPDDVEGQQYMRGVPPDPSNTFWGLDVFVDGQHVRLLRCDQMVVPNPLCHGCSPDIATGPDDVADSGKPCVSPTATAVLQQVDFQRWCAAERAPIWAQLHELDCPEPRRPERLYLYAVEKDGIPRTTDLAPPAGGERYADVLSRLTQAQKIVDPARRGERLAAFTWLWERGGELDPAFSLARIGLVLPHLTDLGRSDPAARDRLVRIADSELVLYPWFDDHEEVAYLALRAASGGGDQAVMRLIVENVDLDEETMGAIVASRLGKLKAQITQLPLERPMDAGRWKEFLRVANAPLPRTIDAEPRDRWHKASAELLTIAAVRSYALLLASDRAPDHDRAAQIAADVLKKAEKAPPPVRANIMRAMVFAACSVGKGTSTHAAWLAEAARLDPPVLPESGKSPASADPLVRALPAPAK